MRQTYFQFKQFRIEQDRCGMKVSTDACIQGAWAARQLLQSKRQPTRILDIGTGSGLLSLMLAQKLKDSHFLAIEPEPEAYAQAMENFKSSPWSSRMEVLNIDLENLDRSGDYSDYFDVIICNPPFFKKQLKSPDPRRDRARHDGLPMEQLARIAALLLKSTGIFCVMYPEREWLTWLPVAREAGWLPAEALQVRPRATQSVNRRIAFFSRKQETEAGKESIKEELSIYEPSGAYTSAFVKLLNSYYLKRT